LPRDYSNRQIKKLLLDNGVKVLLIQEPQSLSGVSMQINFQGMPGENDYSNFQQEKNVLRYPYFITNEFPPGIQALFLETVYDDSEMSLVY